jgi:PDDEXK-like domain of unknown function (DUF3799)
MNAAELEKAIKREVEEWPGVTVAFVEGGKHPKYKLTYDELMLSRPYPGTPGDSGRGLHNSLAEVRRVIKQLGGVRLKPEPSEEEDEAPYRKPNDGAEKRSDPPREKAAPEPTIRDKAKAAGIVVREIVNVLDEGQSEDDGAKEAKRAAIQSAVDSIVDGIYFGLDEQIYHAVPALGGSALCKLNISPATWWRGSWLDPDRPELDEEQTIAQLIGKAYHSARLEPEHFEDRFCAMLDKANYPSRDFVSSDAAVKAALKEMGQTQALSGEPALERAERLRDLGFTGTIWAIEKAAWEAEIGDRQPIPAKYWKDIVIDMERIRGVPDIAALLTGGASEVSVFWTDEFGLRCKARFDYLKANHWSELKTFANSQGKDVNQAITDAVRYNRYYIAAGHYREAAEQIRTGDLAVRGPSTAEQRALIEQIQERPLPLACWFVFQEKGGVPNLFAREFRFSSAGDYREGEIAIMLEDENPTVREMARDAMGRKTQIYRRAEIEIRRAKDIFATYAQVYEPGSPWAPLDPIGSIDDGDFHPRWLEGNG